MACSRLLCKPFCLTAPAWHLLSAINYLRMNSAFPRLKLLVPAYCSASLIVVPRKIHRLYNLFVSTWLSQIRGRVDLVLWWSFCCNLHVLKVSCLVLNSLGWWIESECVEKRFEGRAFSGRPVPDRSCSGDNKLLRHQCYRRIAAVLQKPVGAQVSTC